MAADERTRLQALAIAQALGKVTGAQTTARIESKFTEAEKRSARQLVVNQAVAATGKERSHVEEIIQPQLGLFGLGAIAAAIAPKVISGGVKLARQAIGGAPAVVRKLPGAALTIGGTGAAAGYGANQAIQALSNPGATVPMNGGGSQALTGPVIKNAAAAGLLPLTVQPEYVQRAKCPRGYVAVDYMGGQVCMLKGCARDLGLWKARPRALVTAAEGRTLRKARATARKIDRVAKMADQVTGKKRTRTVYKMRPPARRRSSK